MRCFFTGLIVLILLPAQVFASDTYVKGSAGLLMMDNSDVHFQESSTGLEINGDVSFNDGFSLSASVGKSFKNGLDIELEYSHKEVTSDKLSFEEVKYRDQEYIFLEITDLDINNSLFIKTFMANAIYNFCNGSEFTPYIGAGFGGGWADWESGPESTQFTYQAMVGIDVRITNNTSLLVGYKYFGMDDLKEKEQLTLAGTQLDIYGTQFDGESSYSVDSHSAEFGLKYSF